MKTNKSILAMRWTMLVLAVCFTLPVSAQRHKSFTFEIGVNHPVDLGDTSVDVGGMFGGYIQFSKMLKQTPLSIDCSLAYTQFNKTTNINDYQLVEDDWVQTGSHKRYEETWALSLIPSLNYHFYRTKKVDAYAGLGLGVSINAIDSYDASPGPGYASDDSDPIYLTSLPRIGVLIANHLNISFEYYLFHKNLNRGSIAIGFVF